MKSLTFYIVLLVLKIKGLKKTFSETPIDYKKLRKEDIHTPPSAYFKQNARTKTFKELKTTITEIAPNNNPHKLLIYIHGGAFVSGPSRHHWDTIEQISKQTGYTIWMCDYPKAPEHKIGEISKNIDRIYFLANQRFKPQNITLMGDSVGGNLIITLAQRLVKTPMALPEKLILVSPVVDASFQNPEIEAIDKIDPMLSKKGVLSAKLMCAEDNDLQNPSISPLNGTLENLPETFLFVAENDITYPDQKLFIQKLKDSNVAHTVFVGEGMPHIWPLLPIMKEAKQALDKIISILNCG